MTNPQHGHAPGLAPVSPSKLSACHFTQKSAPCPSPSRQHGDPVMLFCQLTLPCSLLFAQTSTHISDLRSVAASSGSLPHHPNLITSLCDVPQSGGNCTHCCCAYGTWYRELIRICISHQTLTPWGWRTCLVLLSLAPPATGAKEIMNKSLN